MLIVSEYISSKRTLTLAYSCVVGDVEHSRSMKDTFAEGLLHDRVWGQRGMHGSFPTLGIGYLTGEKGQQVAGTEVISMPAEVCSQQQSSAFLLDLVLVGGGHIYTALHGKD